MIKNVVALAILLSLASMKAEALHSHLCGNYQAIEKRLRQHYNEVPTSFGVSNKGNLIELWVSESESTWTLLVRNPNSDIVCVLDVGEGWSDFLPSPSKT